MSIYNKQRDGDWVTTKQTEIPIYGSDRLGLVRRDLVLTKGAVCEGCGEPKEDPIDPSELRIIELNHDSPLTEPNAKTEVNLGEYIVLKNTSGRNLALGDVQVGQGEDWWQFSASDTIEPNAYALICYGTSADQTEFLSANNLPTALTTDPTVQWHWQSTISFPDAEGQATVRLYENGKPGATLDQVYWNPDGLQAINAYCDATCQADPNREAVVSLQLDDYTYDPINPWDASKWTTAEATAKGKGSSQPEAPSAVRGLLKKEYELKDHLGNVHVVVTDRKHSTIGAGPSIGEFKADVVVMRDYYPFGMEMEGQGYAAGEYRYGFNGMERDNELKGSGDSYDFGARMYDPRVGRWMSRDPLEKNYTSFSSFSFSENSPIIMMDIGGEYPIIVITNQKVGKTRMTVHGSKDIVVEVDLYRVRVFDSESPNFVWNYACTRDGFEYSDGNLVSGATVKANNVCFEPSIESLECIDGEEYARYNFQFSHDDYPRGNTYGADMPAGRLLNRAFEKDSEQAESLSAQFNQFADRTFPDVSTGILIHIGGVYIFKGKNPFGSSETRIASSGGCFGLASEKNPNGVNNAIPGDFKRVVSGLPDSDNAEVWIQKRESRPQSIEIDSNREVFQQNCSNYDE